MVVAGAGKAAEAGATVGAAEAAGAAAVVAMAGVAAAETGTGATDSRSGGIRKPAIFQRFDGGLSSTGKGVCATKHLCHGAMRLLRGCARGQFDGFHAAAGVSEALERRAFHA